VYRQFEDSLRLFRYQNTNFSAGFNLDTKRDRMFLRLYMGDENQNRLDLLFVRNP
jgi:hypothetical protein